MSERISIEEFCHHLIDNKIEFLGWASLEKLSVRAKTDEFWFTFCLERPPDHFHNIDIRHTSGLNFDIYDFNLSWHELQKSDVLFIKLWNRLIRVINRAVDEMKFEKLKEVKDE